MRPRLLDLYCGQGGAGAGYHRAGWDVVGVDRKPQPRYPFEFHQADALEFLTEHAGEFDAVHGSPPCQAYSTLRHLPTVGEHPELIDATRDALNATGLPWVIENVPGAPLRAPITLCGTMFGLGARGPDGIYRQLLRHRLFEHHPDVTLWPPFTCEHTGPFIGVYGGGHTNYGKGYTGAASESAAALGVDWMSRRGMSQAIPPVYTEHLGRQLLAAL